MTDDLKNKFAEPFVEMAVRIARNLETEFAGAVLIVPPTGEPVAVLVTDPSQDLEAFWSVVAGKVAVAQNEIMQSKSGAGSGNWPRR